MGHLVVYRLRVGTACHLAGLPLGGGGGRQPRNIAHAYVQGVRLVVVEGGGGDRGRVEGGVETLYWEPESTVMTYVCLLS